MYKVFSSIAHMSLHHELLYMYDQHALRVLRMNLEWAGTGLGPFTSEPRALAGTAAVRYAPHHCAGR